MKSTTFAVCLAGLASVLAVGFSMIIENDLNRADERTVHFFVLVVPDTTVQELRRARQEEEVGTEITETGVYVGQIISGVLGGDVRPIFAGSASFIDEPDVQQGVSTILANVAPSVNNILKQWFTRVQTALGINVTSTVRPGTVMGGNAQSNGQVQRLPAQPGQTGQRLTAQQQLNLQQQQQQQSQQGQQYAPLSQVVPGSNVLSGSDLFESTTVEPLPLINLKPTDEDNEEESDNNAHKSVKH